MNCTQQRAEQHHNTLTFRQQEKQHKMRTVIQRVSEAASGDRTISGTDFPYLQKR